MASVAAPEAATAPSEPAMAPATTQEVKPTVIAEEPEPQNALTEKFTEAEWKALKEFRANLPIMLGEVFKDNGSESDAVKPVVMWGVSITAEGSKDAKLSVVLMKFLRARNLSISEASEMLVNTLRWREEMKIDEIMKEQFDPKIFGGLGYVHGKDKGGRPVTYNIYGGNQDLKAVFGDLKRFIRWRVSLMEKGMQQLDFENVDQLVQIHDYEGVSLSSRTPESKAAAAEATNIFQSHYPETLYKKYFINVPTIMSWLFWVFKPLMASATLAKMSVVGRGPSTIGKELLVVIDAKELPKKYGGEAEDLSPGTSS